MEKEYDVIPFTEKKEKVNKEKKIKKDKKPRSKLNTILTFIIIVLVIIAGVLFYIIKNVDLKDIFSTNINYTTEKEVTVTDKGIADAVDKLYGATVIVEVGKSEESISGWGSGFVYKTDDKYGYILTNAHVVESISYIKIVTSDENEVEGELVGYDTYSDVAVVKIPVKNVIEVATIGSSDDIRVGDTVFAIGTPISLSYSFTVTRGILSGKNRMVSMSSSSSSSIFGTSTSDTWYMSLLQIDASINSGNSGGPLANSNGEVIGITNSKLSSSSSSYFSSSSASIENIGFAIPIEDALAVATQLEDKGKVERPVLGVATTDIKYASNYNVKLSDDVTYGALITEVKSDSAAEMAGLKAGDVITKIGDYEVKNYLYLKYYLYRYNLGDKVTLTYIRNNKEQTTTLTIRN